MSLEVADRAAAHRRRRFWLITVAVLGLVLVVTGLVALVAGDEASAPASPGLGNDPVLGEDATAASPTPTELSRPPQSAAAWVPPTRQVVLPLGSDQIDELPVGFPQSPDAAAAEVAKDRYSSTLDYELANLVARVYMAPELAATADGASTAAVRALRAKVGVAEAGTPSPGVAVTTRPIGVQWTAIAPDRTEVSVLAQVDYRSSERAWTELAASTTVWEWRPGDADRPADWRLVDGREASARLARLGTPAFNTEGWAAIVTAVPQ